MQLIGCAVMAEVVVVVGMKVTDVPFMYFA